MNESTIMPESDVKPSGLRSLVDMRASLRSIITKRPVLWRATRALVSATVLADILLAILTLGSITARQSAAGIGFLDALPLALYILPLVVVLPSLALSYYRHETGLVNLVILLVSATMFAVMAVLVKGFTLVVCFNIIAAVIIVLMGQFRPRVGLKALGKKGIAWFLILNIIGLTFPVSVYLMGDYPIASSTPVHEPTVFIEVPLAAFDGIHSVTVPNATIVSSVTVSGFGLNFRLLVSDVASLALLSDWVIAVNNTDIPIIVTLSTDRSALVTTPCDRLGTTELFQTMFTSIADGLNDSIDIIEQHRFQRERCTIRFDLSLSAIEWEALMSRTRSVDLGAFSLLVRNSIDSTDVSLIDSAVSKLIELAEQSDIDCGARVEGFVLDDAVDGDTQTMIMCGTTLNSLGRMQSSEVSCLRSSYSIGMTGDVGEYLVHSYSRTVSLGLGGSTWSMQLGVVGNTVTSTGSSVYTLEGLVNDIATAAGNGVRELTVSSLDTLLKTYGSDALVELRDALDNMTSQAITYTFRIFAFRAVFMAIDTYDPLMF